MADKKFFFLSGLSRSGSTLLGSILNQNKDIHVSPTSLLLDYIYNTDILLNSEISEKYSYNREVVHANIHRASFNGFYAHVDAKYIIDKHRGWAKNTVNVSKLFGDVKILCTYRPLAEVVVSFMKLCEKDPENIVDKKLRQLNLQINKENRANFIFDDYVIGSDSVYESLKFGLDNARDNIHLIHYDDLVLNTEQCINKVYDFLEIDKFEHNFEVIDNTCGESTDKIWGFEGLHDVRNKIEKQSCDVNEYLTPELIEKFSYFDEQLGI